MAFRLYLSFPPSFSLPPSIIFTLPQGPKTPNRQFLSQLATTFNFIVKGPVVVTQDVLLVQTTSAIRGQQPKTCPKEELKGPTQHITSASIPVHHTKQVSIRKGILLVPMRIVVLCVYVSMAEVFRIIIIKERV